MDTVPVCVSDFKHYLTRAEGCVQDYYCSGAGLELTTDDNEKAFTLLKLRPRVFAQDVSVRNLSTSLLGSPVDSPIGVAPTSFHRLVWPDGELSSARGAKKENMCYILSNGSNTTMEDVATATEGSLKWYQIYIMKNRETTKDMARRAAANGYKALVLTADNPIIGSRWVGMRNPLELPKGLTVANLDYENQNACFEGGVKLGGMVSMSTTWKDLEWLKQVSGLPVIVKGITCGEDARLAVEHGAAAVYVSNHGGRHLDTIPATINILPEIVQAVNGKAEIYFDGGVRSGTDALKALALGAHAVFVGRPILWGLAYKGSEGVSSVLKILNEELSVAMAICGCRNLSDIGPRIIRQSYQFAKL